MKVLGKEIAELARKGAEISDCGKMCHDCAFRPQKDINGYSAAVQDAASLLETGQGIYNCHTAEYTNAGKPCVGFQYASKFIEHTAKQVLETLKSKP